MSGIIHNCRACGAVIELEQKFCTSCGAENVLRLEEIAKLEKKRNQVDKRHTKILEGGSRKKSILRDFIPSTIPSTKKSMLGDSTSEFWDKRLTVRSRELRMKQTKLMTGNTHEGILQWVKTQYYDLKRTIQEIADDLGESMIAVGKYLDEIENQEK